MFESRGICSRWAFNRKSCRRILRGTKQMSALSNMTRGRGLVITILTCNLTSTPQGLDIAKDALITFCFARVSCDIQIRQLINDIKCGSALGDCVPLSSATVINIKTLLKATSYFSPSLHYVWIFTSRIFLNKKNWVDYWVYHCLNLKLRLRQYPSNLLPLSYHKYYKGTNDKDIRNEFTILYVRDLILLNRWYTIFAISKPITRLSLLPILLSWSSMRRTRWPPKSPSLYADVVGSPREDSHTKIKGILVGKLKLNPWGRPMWVWLKLKLSLKGDFCEVSVTAFFANFFMYSPKKYLNEYI